LKDGNNLFGPREVGSGTAKKVRSTGTPHILKMKPTTLW